MNGVRVRARANQAGGGLYFAAPAAGVRFFSTGCRLLDLTLGGGWAVGRVVNVVGDKSTGKTLLMIEASANFAITFPKGRIIYKECESAFDKGYASALGMPIDRVEFDEKHPIDTVEDLFDDLERKLKEKKNREPMLYIVDSLDALTDRAEALRDISEGSYGAQKAKKMSEMFRRLVRRLEEANITLAIVSQIRDKIGVIKGRKTQRTGGRALDFYASQIVYLNQTKTLVKTIGGVQRPVAIEVQAKCTKNKVGLPFRECTFEIRFAFGIDDLTACFNWLHAVKFKPEHGDKIPPNVKETVLTLMAARDGSYERWLELAHEWVSLKWYDLEKEFLPTRQKYAPPPSTVEAPKRRARAT